MIFDLIMGHHGKARAYLLRMVFFLAIFGGYFCFFSIWNLIHAPEELPLYQHGFFVLNLCILTAMLITWFGKAFKTVHVIEATGQSSEYGREEFDYMLDHGWDELQNSTISTRKYAYPTEADLYDWLEERRGLLTADDWESLRKRTAVKRSKKCRILCLEEARKAREAEQRESLMGRTDKSPSPKRQKAS